MSVSAAATAPTLEPARSAAQLPDFSERLSPMLVKELRQGMRSPVFVWGLIVMNFFLAVIVWLTMLDPGEDSLHQAFFGAYCALVCGLLPLRAAGALHDELRGNTIDTLILTRLTGWRIALGKWVAVAQQGLAAITVLPYLIVRYFAGGINVPMELAWLGIFLLAGMGSAAVLTGLSWIRYFLFRAAVMMGMTFLTGAFCASVLDEMFGYRRQYILDQMVAQGGWQLLLLMLVPAMHLAFFALDLGASKVGSLVENRAMRRRVTGACVIVFYLVMAMGFSSSRSSYGMGWIGFVVPLMLAGATLLILGWQALLELPLNLVAVVHPMVKRGRWGRIAGRFLYPGWPSGVCYTFAILVVAGLIAAGGLFLRWEASSSYSSIGPRGFVSTRDLSLLVAGPMALIGLLPVPLVIWQLFFRKRLPWNLGIYGLLLLTVAALELGVIAMAASLENPGLLKWGLPIPTMSWAWLAEPSPGWNSWDEGTYFDWDDELIARVSGSVSLSWWLAALLLADRAFRTTRAVEREAAALLPPRPVAAQSPSSGET